VALAREFLKIYHITKFEELLFSIADVASVTSWFKNCYGNGHMDRSHVMF
jgi:hypothetical protein